MVEDFAEGYELFEQLVSTESAAASVDAEWIRALVEACDKALEDLNSYEGDARTLESLSGSVAETWHASTFNISKAAQEAEGATARVPKSTKFASPDVTIGDREFSLKYYKSGVESAKQQAKTFNELAHEGRPGAIDAIGSGANPNDSIYVGQGKVIPSDQLTEAKEYLQKRADTEAARRPEQARRYRDTLDSISDVVDDGSGASSRGLSRSDAKRLAEEARQGNVDAKKWRITPAQNAELRKLFNNSMKAGLSAAAIAAALEAAPELLTILHTLVSDGWLNIDALEQAGIDAAAAGGKGFAAGATTAAIIEAFELASIQTSPQVIGAVVVLATRTISNSIKVSNGEMTNRELAEAAFRDSFVTTCALLAGGTTQVLTPHIPALGFFIGSFVGSALGGMAYSAGEKVVLSLCVEKGFSFFGLVEQDYRLPEEIIEKVGLDLFDLEQIELNKLEFETFKPDAFVPDQINLKPLRFEYLNRGIIGISRVGYLPL